MNNIIKNAAFFVIGAAAGSGATYYILNKRLEKHYADKADSEIQSVKDVYLAKCADLDKVRKLHDAKSRVEDIIFNSKYDGNDAADENMNIEYKENHNGNNDDDDADEEDIEADLVYPMEGDINPKPYSITPTEFVHSMTNFDKETLLYFEDGGMVVGANDDRVIDSPEDILGIDFTSLFGEFEEDVAYIRNETIATDFEVIKNEGRWSGSYDFGKWDDSD